ncbi:hypothetical protein BHE74_00049208 [Ensete ventricosum]|nr:hypothetical protein BHE74_00049208 [Ensete ventricosum]
MLPAAIVSPPTTLPRQPPLSLLGYCSTRLPLLLSSSSLLHHLLLAVATTRWPYLSFLCRLLFCRPCHYYFSLPNHVPDAHPFFLYLMTPQRSSDPRCHCFPLLATISTSAATQPHRQCPLPCCLSPLPPVAVTPLHFQQRRCCTLSCCHRHSFSFQAPSFTCNPCSRALLNCIHYWSLLMPTLLPPLPSPLLHYNCAF